MTHPLFFCSPDLGLGNEAYEHNKLPKASTMTFAPPPRESAPEKLVENCLSDFLEKPFVEHINIFQIISAMTLSRQKCATFVRSIVELRRAAEKVPKTAASNVASFRQTGVEALGLWRSLGIVLFKFRNAGG